MPMMVLLDDEFNKEISKFNSKSSDKKPELVDTEVDSIKNKIEQAIENTEFKTEPGGKVVDILRGRGSARLEVPSAIRQLVAEEVINGVPAKQVARAFNISESSVSAYKHDATSTASYDSPDSDLAKANNEVRENISAQARSKLLRALAHVTDDKLAEAKLRDVASVAASMSGIIKNLEPSNNFISQQNTQVIVYKPRQKDEDEFEIITVNE